MALAAIAISEAGCDCDEAETGVHTCLSGLCEIALFMERNRAEVSEQHFSYLQAEVDRMRKKYETCQTCGCDLEPWEPVNRCETCYLDTVPHREGE